MCFGQSSEVTGTVQIEAESCTNRISRAITDPTFGTITYAWQNSSAIAGFGGSGLVQVLPNDGTLVNTNWTTVSPELRFSINFTNTGTYYVWVRGYADSAQSSSVYVGLNGASPASAQIDLPKTGAWSWANTALGSSVPVAVTVNTTGTHTLNLWMRTAGFAVDRIVLTLNSRYSPEYSADFWRNQSIYQIITDRFFNGDTGNDVAGLPNFNATNGGQAHGGDFKGIEKKLDYIKALGATAIWISPVVKNANGDYHGYAATDFYAVNPRMGTLADLQRLIAEAHKRGILVINDVVANHGSTWVDSAEAGWGTTFRYPPAGYTLRYNSGGQQYAAPFANSNLTSAFGNTNLTNIFHNQCGGIQNYGDSVQVELGELVSLDDFRTESPYVRAKMKEIWSYWISTAGFDAYRIDTVKHVEMGFWDEWSPAIRAAAQAADKPNFFQFGEVFDGNDAKVGSYTGTKSGGNYKMESVLDYPLYYQVGSVFATASGNTGQIEGRYANLTTNNYDASSLNSLVLNLDNHDNPRFLSTAIGGNTARLEVALAFLYTSRGIPSLYYGTEQDFDGGADPWNREDMFAGGFEGGPSIGDNFNMTSARFRLVAKLNNLRRLYPSLRTGSHVNLWANPSGPGLLAYARRLGTEEVYVVLNTASTAQTIGARPTIHPAGTVLVNVLNPIETYTVTSGADGIPSITMPATSYKIFVAQTQQKALAPIISAVSPSHDTKSISPASAISLTFDRAMNPATTQAAFSTVPASTGTFTWGSGNTVMTYTPSSSLAGNTLYGVRLESTATDTNGLAMFAPFESRFTTGAAVTTSRPSVNSVTISGITTSGATLGATVTPNGAATTVNFQYGTSTAYGASTPTQSIGSGNSPVTTSATLTGLQPGTAYFFRVVATNSQGTTFGPDTSFTTQALLPQVNTTAASFIATTSASLNGEVNPNGMPTTFWFEYGARPDLLDTLTPVQDAGSAAGFTGKWASLSGLSPEATYYFRIVAQSGTNVIRGSVLSFATLPVKPTLGTVTSQNVGPTTATLSAAVNPNGTDSSVWFEYGLESTYGLTTPIQTAGAGVPSPVSITANLTGLSPGKTYHYRAAAQNGFGLTYGSDQTFVTDYPPPSVATGPVTSVNTNSASLSGTVNPNGLESIYWFEYGLTTSYGASTMSGASDDLESYTTSTLVYSSTSAGATVTANGGSGFGQFTSYVRTTSASTSNPTRGGITCVTSNSINGMANRQIDGNESVGVYAGSSTTTGNHSGYRPITAPRQFGQVKFSARFDISNTKGFTGVNLKSANGASFGDSELISVGLMPGSGAVGGNTAVMVTDAAGQKNINLGADVRRAILDFRIDFDTVAGTYTCGVKFRADPTYQTITGALKLSGTGVNLTTLGYINGNNTGELAQNLILDNLQVVSAPSAGLGVLPLTVTGNLAGLVANTTYHYRLVAQNSKGQTAGADAVLFTGSSNTAPTISSISGQTTDEDTPSGSIAFTVADAETAAASLVVTATSDNVALIPNTNSNIALGGSGTNRTVVLTPAPNANGTANITVNVSDGMASASRSFLLTVNPVNDSPTIGSIPNQTLFSGVTNSPIPFTVGDLETASGSLAVTGTSSNTNLVANGSLVFGGSGPNRTLSIAPVAGQTGTSTITVSVSDGSLSATSAFVLTVNAPNTAPTIGAISAQTTDEDVPTAAISFTVGDAETAADSLTVTASSDNPTLIPNGSVLLGGSGTNRTVTLTPVANANGVANITVYVSDGSATTNRSFLFTVNPVNDAPTISSLSNQVVRVNSPTGALTFTVGDIETSPGLLTLSGTSSNTNIVTSNNIVFGGSGANRTVTVTPVTGQTGTATVTLTVSDGAATATTSFTLTVTPGPTISNIADQSILVGTNTGPVAFTISDAGSLSLTGSSSNTNLVTSNNIVFGGSGTNRTVTVTPVANQTGAATITVTVSDGTLSANDTFVLNVNQAPDISVEYSKAADGASNSIYSNSFVGLNGGYGFGAWAGSRTGTNAGTYFDTSTNGLKSFAIYAGGGTGNSYSASRSFSSTMVPGENFSVQLGYTPVNTGGEIGLKLFSGTNTNALFAIRLTSGTTTQWELNDGGTYWGSGITSAPGNTLNFFFKRSLAGSGYDIRLSSGTSAIVGTNWGTSRPVMAIDRVEFYSTAQGAYQNFRFANLERMAPAALADSPTFDLGTARVGNTGNTATFTVRNEGAGPLSGLALATSGTNSADFVPGVLGTNRLAPGEKTTFQAIFQPKGGGARSANLAVTSNDPDENPCLIRLSGSGFNTAPAISQIPDQTSTENSPIGPVGFLVGDPETPANALTVTATSSNPNLIGGSNLSVSGTDADRALTAVPAANQSGTADITLTVSDGDLATSRTFRVAVAAVNSPPAISSLAYQTIGINTATLPLSFTVQDAETTDLTVTAVSSNPGLVPPTGITLDGLGANRTVVITPAANQTGEAFITLSVNDGISITDTVFKVTVLNALDHWKNLNFGSYASSALAADTNAPAGDGISNLVKYALGISNVLTPATNGLPEMKMTNNKLAFTFNRQKNAVDVIYEVQATGDLFGFSNNPTVLWSSASNAYGGGTNASQVVTVEDTVDASATNRRFMRLQISRP